MSWPLTTTPVVENDGVASSIKKHNRLLDALPGDIFERLLTRFQSVTLTRGTVLHRPGDVIEHLYFPLDCIISITVTMAEGKTIETAAVGNREVVGINAFMGGSETTQTEYVVQVDGTALRIQAEPLLRAFDENKAVRDVLLKYTQALVAQVSQNTGCNRVHGMERRYARWLLEVLDRVGSDDLKLPQEFVADMLGVRRPTVSVAATALQEKRLIRIGRGRTCIIDVDRLKGASCECYEVLQSEYDRLLGRRPPRTIPLHGIEARSSGVASTSSPSKPVAY
jgi:CRP-like cAMP-binding protein